MKIMEISPNIGHISTDETSPRLISSPPIAPGAAGPTRIPCLPNPKSQTSRPPYSRRFAVPSKPRKLTPAEIEVLEAGRDIGAEILQSIRDLKASKGKVVLSPVVEARNATGLSQTRFSALLGVSVRTLQGWEQGRKQPSGAARTLLTIARMNPQAIPAVAGS
jgi:putative transcriptional regulator